MSYDVSIEILDAKGELHELFWRNITCNVAPMWRLAGIDLREWDGVRPSSVVGPLSDAIAKMQANPDVYTPLNPENGWGDYLGCLTFLLGVEEACVRWPDMTLRVSH